MGNAVGVPLGMRLGAREGTVVGASVLGRDVRLSNSTADSVGVVFGSVEGWLELSKRVLGEMDDCAGDMTTAPSVAITAT